MNYIITNNKEFFEKIGQYNYCKLEDMILPKTIAVDTETTSLYPRKGHMFAVQIGTGENNYLIDLQQLGGELFFEQVKPYLDNHILVFHNATFDLGWFYKYDFFEKYEIYDTMIASMLLQNGVKGSRNDFGTVMRVHLDAIYDKTEQKNIAKTQLSNKEAIQYCFNDVDRLIELMKVLAKKMQDYGVIPAFKLHCRYVKALAYMEQCGLPINVDKWKAKIEEDLKELAAAEQKVVEYIYDTLPQFRDPQLDLFSTEKRIVVNLASSQQMIPVFEAYGVNVESDEDPEKKTIGKDTIKRSGHEFVDIWLKYQESAHDVSTYGQNILDKVEDGFIYTTFNPMLDTARISTRRNEFNCLNLPANERTRDCFEAKEGFSIIVADFDSQENVQGADFHQDPIMIASIVNGDCLHCALARVLFPSIAHLDDETIKKEHKDKRNFAKPVRFAKAYGGNGYTISKNQNLSLEEGESVSLAYDELHAAVKIWGEGILAKAIEVGYIESAEGFKLKLPFFEDFKQGHDQIESLDKDFWKSYRMGKEEYKKVKEAASKEETYEPVNYKEYKLYSDNKSWISHYFKTKSKYLRLCLNNPVQATSAFVTKRAAVLLFEEILKNNHQHMVQISNIIHDELLLHVDNQLVTMYKPILERCMLQGGDFYLTSGLVRHKAQANSGKTWYEAK